MTGQRLLNEREAAQLLGLSPKTLQDRRLKRRPPTYLKLGHAVRYRASDLEAFIQQSTIQLT